jgi:hypothetical protein
LKKVIKEDPEVMAHGHGTQQGLFFPHVGVRLSEDTATLLSPQMIDEFVLPYMKMAAEPFGGAFVHFCGRHEYLFEEIVNQDFVTAIDLGNPGMYNIEWLFERCANTDTIFYGKTGCAGDISWRDYISKIAAIVRQTGARCVLRPDVFPSDRQECEQMQKMWHALTA